jgi:hypothetical protein
MIVNCECKRGIAVFIHAHANEAGGTEPVTIPGLCNRCAAQFEEKSPELRAVPAGRPRRTSITDRLSFVLTLRPNALKLVRPEVRANFPEAKTDAHALAMSLIIKAANKRDLATWRERDSRNNRGKTRYR